MEFSNKLYDILKWLCLIFFPALCVFLSAVLPLVGVDAETVKTVVLIISAVATFIGTLIGVSTVAYNAKVDAIFAWDDETADDNEKEAE